MATYAVEKNKKITLKQRREIELKFYIGLTREKPEKVTERPNSGEAFYTYPGGRLCIYLFIYNKRTLYTNALQILIHLIYMVTYETHFIIIL